MSTPAQSAAKRVLETYGLIFDVRTAENAKHRVVDFIERTFAAGETDADRLAVACLKHLRQSDSGA